MAIGTSPRGKPSPRKVSRNRLCSLIGGIAKSVAEAAYLNGAMLGLQLSSRKWRGLAGLAKTKGQVETCVSAAWPLIGGDARSWNLGRPFAAPDSVSSSRLSPFCF